MSSSPVLARKFRGKTAKEIYRCSKGILLTGSVAKSIEYSIATIPTELSKRFVCMFIRQLVKLVKLP